MEQKSNIPSTEFSLPLKEKQWVRRVREEEDREAFERIFRTHYQNLHGFAYSFVGDREGAEDIVQKIFLTIWEQRKTWDPPGTVKQYLFAATRNEALNVLRHQKVKADSQEEVINIYSEYNVSSSNDEDVEALRAAIQCGIDQLPPRCRQIFLLNRRSGLSYIEISEYLDISTNTVSTQMGRALKSLREYLSDYVLFLLPVPLYGAMKLLL